MVTHNPQNGNAARSQEGCERVYSSATTSSRFETDETSAPPAQNPLEPLLKSLGEMREYVSYYLTTSADSVKLSIRNAVLYGVLGLLGLIVGAALLVTAAVLVLQGIANGLTILFDGRAWAGQLTTGMVVLVLAALVTWFGLKRLMNSSRQKTIEKYEHRRNQQRAAFGHDVHDKADAHKSHQP